jgi:hypothetical protein
MKLMWFTKKRHLDTARRFTGGFLVVIYLLVTSSGNLFHTESYNHNQGDSNSQTDSYFSFISADSTQSGAESYSRSGTACPVCAFFKAHNGQVYHGCILVSLTTPPARDYRAVEVVFPFRHPLPSLQRRGPPA